MEMLFVPYHFLQSVITKITGAVIVACSAYFYINGTISAVYAIGMTISAFMLYASLECAGNYSSLLHVVSVCVDKANAMLELDTMDIDGKEIQPENYDIRLSHISFSYDKRKIIDDVSLSIPQKTTTAIVGPSGEENQNFAIRRTAGNEELICLANFSEYGQNGEENEKI